MKLKELKIVGGSVYLNIVRKEETETRTMPSKAAVKKYGDLEVIEHIPYDPTVEKQDADTDNVSVEQKGNAKKSVAIGTDIVILKG